MSSIFLKKVLPPGRDSQEEAPAWLCALCGGEQYGWDRPVLRRGRPVCPQCLDRLEEEEE